MRACSAAPQVRTSGLARLAPRWLLAAIFLIGAAEGARAGSDAAFPADWQNWPVVKAGVIGGIDTPIPAAAPRIVQETIKTYNWVNDGKGSAYRVRVSPAQSELYRAGRGVYPDGPTAVLELTDAKVILVTDHLLGEPQYGVFSFDGKDLVGAHPSLQTSVCTNCHSGYADLCVAGICSAGRK